MPIQQSPEQLTPREAVEMEFTKEENRLSREFALESQRLDIQLASLEAKWSSWLKIPVTIIKLPVLMILAIGYCIAIARKIEPGDNYWKFLK